MMGVATAPAALRFSEPIAGWGAWWLYASLGSTAVSGLIHWSDPLLKKLNVFLGRVRKVLRTAFGRFWSWWSVLPVGRIGLGSGIVFVVLGLLTAGPAGMLCNAWVWAVASAATLLLSGANVRVLWATARTAVAAPAPARSTSMPGSGSNMPGRAAEARRAPRSEAEKFLFYSFSALVLFHALRSLLICLAWIFAPHWVDLSADAKEAAASVRKKDDDVIRRIEWSIGFLYVLGYSLNEYDHLPTTEQITFRALDGAAPAASETQPDSNPAGKGKGDSNADAKAKSLETAGAAPKPGTPPGAGTDSASASSPATTIDSIKGNPEPFRKLAAAVDRRFAQTRFAIQVIEIFLGRSYGMHQLVLVMTVWSIVALVLLQASDYNATKLRNCREGIQLLGLLGTVVGMSLFVADLAKPDPVAAILQQGSLTGDLSWKLALAFNKTATAILAQIVLGLLASSLAGKDRARELWLKSG